MVIGCLHIETSYPQTVIRLRTNQGRRRICPTLGCDDSKLVKT